MKKTLKFLCLALMATLAFTSCDNDDVQIEEPKPHIEGLIIMNNGNWGSNDANMMVYDPATGLSDAGIFASINKQPLGDLGQDILRVGDELWIAVNGSKLIYVTDLMLNIKHTVVVEQSFTQDGETKGIALSPRSLATANGKVYVTYYEGYLGEIETKNYTARVTPVGNSPEGLACTGGKIYVANSGGALYPNYDNTISVVDAATFKETERITVNTNPQAIVASPDGKRLYVSSWGDYAAAPAMLQTIDVAGRYAVTDLEYSDVKSIVAGEGDDLYVVSGGYDANWQVTGSIYVHDMKTNTTKGLFTEDQITNYYSISYTGGYVVVGASDYKTNGDVYLYDKQGRLVKKFDSQGLNPQKAIML